MLEAQKSGSPRSGNNTVQMVTIISNVVLLGFVCWALVDTYPYAQEEGFIAYVILMTLTPILTLAALSEVFV